LKVALNIITLNPFAHICKNNLYKTEFKSIQVHQSYFILLITDFKHVSSKKDDTDKRSSHKFPFANKGPDTIYLGNILLKNQPNIIFPPILKINVFQSSRISILYLLKQRFHSLLCTLHLYTCM